MAGRTGQFFHCGELLIEAHLAWRRKGATWPGFGVLREGRLLEACLAVAGPNESWSRKERTQTTFCTSFLMNWPQTPPMPLLL